MHVTRAPCGEKLPAVSVRRHEARTERVVDFVARPRDAGSDGGHDAAAPCAERFHRGDGGLGDPAERAFPPCMRSADHASRLVGKQHGRAVRSDDAEREIRSVGDDGVGMRTRVVGPGRACNDSFGRMDLINGHERCAGCHGFDRAPTVFGNRVRGVHRPEPDVQPGGRPRRDAAASPKEAVTHPVEHLGVNDLDGHANPAASGHSAAVIAIARNNVPIASAPVSR